MRLPSKQNVSRYGPQLRQGQWWAHTAGDTGMNHKPTFQRIFNEDGTVDVEILDPWPTELWVDELIIDGGTLPNILQLSEDRKTLTIQVINGRAIYHFVSRRDDGRTTIWRGLD